MKRLTTLLLCIVFLLAFPVRGLCSNQWIEEFKNNELLDPGKTDAYVYINPITGGYAELAIKESTGTLGIKEESYDQIILSSEGVEYFMFEDGMLKNPFLSFPIEASSIAINQAGYSTWVATDKEITRLEFDGSGMIENPFWKITGMKNILSISSEPYSTEELAILMKDYTGGGILEYYVSSEKLLSLSLDASLGNPVDIAVVPETMDIVYATDQAVLYFNFDGSSYVQNHMLSVTGIPSPQAISVSEDGYALLYANKKEHYLFTGEGVAYVEALSYSFSDEMVSVALKPNSYDFAVLDQNGKTHYYLFDGSGYIEAPFLSAQAAPILNKYYSPRYYVSKPIKFAEAFRVFILDADEVKPEKTDIKYFLRSGENEWEIGAGDSLILESPINNVVLIAELTGDEATPRITRLCLNGFTMGIKSIKMEMFPMHEDFQHLEKPFPIYPKFPADLPEEYLVNQSTLSLPIPVQKEGVIIFELESLGDPDSANINLELRDGPFVIEDVMLDLTKKTETKWVGILSIPGEINEGSEYRLAYVELSNDIESIEIPPTGYMHNPFLIVRDYPEMNLLNFFKVYLTR